MILMNREKVLIDSMHTYIEIFAAETQKKNVHVKNMKTPCIC